jgi:hypothetical protein
MPALNLRKFAKLDDLTIFLKGHLLGGVDVLRNGSSLYLHGLTLIFNTPSATVTFASSPAGTQVPLKAQDVKTQIEAQTSNGVLVSFNQGRLELRASPAGAINLDSAGTANALLGFDTAVDSAAAPYAIPGGTPPALVEIVPDHGSNSYLVVTNE